MTFTFRCTDNFFLFIRCASLSLLRQVLCSLIAGGQNGLPTFSKTPHLLFTVIVSFTPSHASVPLAFGVEPLSFSDMDRSDCFWRWPALWRGLVCTVGRLFKTVHETLYLVRAGSPSQIRALMRSGMAGMWQVSHPALGGIMASADPCGKARARQDKMKDGWGGHTECCGQDQHSSNSSKRSSFTAWGISSTSE